MTGPHAPFEVYVYYRIAGEPSAARRTITAMIADLAAITGVPGQLLARRDDAGMWLEVYRASDAIDAFLAALAGVVARHRATRHAENEARHLECFVSLAEATSDGPAGG